MKYTKEVLAPVVAQSLSYAEVLRRLGVRWAGGSQSYIKSRILRFDLDTSHFLGQSRQRGKRPSNRRSWQQILVLRLRQQIKESTARLRRAMIESGIPYVCTGCNGTAEWRGQPLVLQVEHKNGQWWDCRRENLEFLCPNCHSQTETWGARNIR